MAGTGTNVCELTHIVNTHISGYQDWPSGLQDFHAFHFEKSAQGVTLKARQLLGSRISNAGSALPWVGNERDSAQLILPTSANLPKIKTLQPQMTAVDPVATWVRNAQFIKLTPADQQWWCTFKERYNVNENQFSTWEPPTKASYQKTPSLAEEHVREAAKILDLTDVELSTINPLPVKFFWSGPRVQKRYSKLSAKELERRGVDSLMEMLTEHQLQEKQKIRKRKRSTKGQEEEQELDEEESEEQSEQEEEGEQEEELNRQEEEEEEEQRRPIRLRRGHEQDDKDFKPSQGSQRFRWTKPKGRQVGRFLCLLII